MWSSSCATRRICGRSSPGSRRRAAGGGPLGGLAEARSGVPTDLDENLVREIGLSEGLVDNKVCAIDATWSGLRFVWRVRDRPQRG